MVEVEKFRATNVSITLTDCERIQLRTILKEAIDIKRLPPKMVSFAENLAIKLHEMGDSE